MEKQFDIEKVIAQGSIDNDLELERAMVAERKLRLLAKENNYFKELRKKLRKIIEEYESMAWVDRNTITEEIIAISDHYEMIADQERLFLKNRKHIIRAKLKIFDLTQENLGQILGHKSKTHVSELMNGMKPFTLRDLMVINWIFGIDFKDLIPNFLPEDERTKVKSAIIKLNKLKLTSEKAGGKKTVSF
jgi:hypothetical protein